MAVQQRFSSFMLLAGVIGILCVGTDSAQATDPIVEIKKISVEKAAYDKKRAADKPIVIKDEKTAKKYFGEKALKKIADKVDFEKQHVLVFAWSGSGQDKLTYMVAESYPEQISFKLTRGRTKDLRQHVRVFAIRSNVKYRSR